LKSIRSSYENLGVEGFYKKSGDTYTNPHEAHIVALLKRNTHRIDYDKVLDFCCGSGEVTEALFKMGFKNTIGSDPFTQTAFKNRIGKIALPLTFDDVIRNGLDQPYSSVISSFAMHLCPVEKLYPLTLQIFQFTKQLIIITPHKRPVLEKLDGVQLDFVDAVLTFRGKEIRLKSYRCEYGI